MKLQDLLDNANAVTDEVIDFKTGVKFINDCIARINIQAQANYPTYTETASNTEMPLPSKWQLALFVPFISAKIKQMDSSKFEMESFFGEFFSNLDLFLATYEIPDEYKDLEENTSIPPNFDQNPYGAGWNTGNNGDW